MTLATIAWLVVLVSACASALIVGALFFALLVDTVRGTQR